jgi:predicted amidohydrolase
MSMRVAVAAVPGCDEIPTRSNVERAGESVHAAMHEAAAQGARVIVFHEGALSYPHKRKISQVAEEVGPADWARADWDALEDQVRKVCVWSRELSIWTVLHAPHRLTEPSRPHNSMYVIDDRGAVVDRYDKRYLSDTEVRWLYTPGARPVTFEVDGYRFGCALCIEAAIPDVFTEYADLGVDCVLYGTSGVNDTNDLHLRAHASLSGIWIAVADQWRDDGSCASGLSIRGARGVGDVRTDPWWYTTWTARIRSSWARSSGDAGACWRAAVSCTRTRCGRTTVARWTERRSERPWPSVRRSTTPEDTSRP